MLNYRTPLFSLKRHYALVFYTTVKEMSNIVFQWAARELVCEKGKSTTDGKWITPKPKEVKNQTKLKHTIGKTTVPAVEWNPADVAVLCLFPVSLVKLHWPCSKCKNQQLRIVHSIGWPKQANSFLQTLLASGHALKTDELW